MDGHDDDDGEKGQERIQQGRFSRRQRCSGPPSALAPRVAP
jgi:hypothetical protein